MCVHIIYIYIYIYINIYIHTHAGCKYLKAVSLAHTSAKKIVNPQKYF